ncbi:MAG: glucuronate isomerase [Propionibacteriaceae bacterium]|jgi:glucuronate isomerase|nr:glucuronate isomerase [Propionibacteriaceae bacterium]
MLAELLKTPWDQTFLLTDDTARTIFEQIRDLPIIDYHSHLDPRLLAENKPYHNLTRIWIADEGVGDHYKWRLMRANGVDEDLITGRADDFEKFKAYCNTMAKAIGNPVYEWSHLELRRYFGLDLALNEANADEIWEAANDQLAHLTPRDLLTQMNVKVAVTTDDPLSDLRFHKVVNDANPGFTLTPSFRPDPLLNINADSFPNYIEELAAATGRLVVDFDSLLRAIRTRMEFFNEQGARVSDHGLDAYRFVQLDDATVDAYFKKRMNGEKLPPDLVYAYRTALMRKLLGFNRELGWAAQIHCGAVRRQNRPLTAELGPDVGFDSVSAQPDLAEHIMRLVRASYEDGALPKLIVYPLNERDWEPISTYLGNFQGEGRQRLQLGAAWWFNDHFQGIHEQLEMFANQSLLGNFTGMLTDSRSFLSYARHEYFRRILASHLADWYKEGRVFGTVDDLVELASDVAYRNAHAYFGFQE